MAIAAMRAKNPASHPAKTVASMSAQSPSVLPSLKKNVIRAGVMGGESVEAGRFPQHRGWVSFRPNPAPPAFRESAGRTTGGPGSRRGTAVRLRAMGFSQGGV